MAGTCQTYSGGYCSQYVNYPIYMAEGSSVAAHEQVLKAGGMDLLLSLNASVPADRPCVGAFLQWACYTAYPSCSNNVVDQVPCQSVCQNAVQQCTTLFTTFGKANLLPNCAANVEALNVPYGSGPSCLGAVPSSLVSISSPPGKCDSYSSGYCSHIINYPVFIADGNPASIIEANLKAGGMDLLLQLNATSATYSPCVNAFLDWACLSAYPRCQRNAISTVTCKSVCQSAVAQCTAMFTTFGKQSTLPDCNGNILNWNTSYSPDSSVCLGGSSQSQNPPPPVPTNVTCPSFLILNPNYNVSNPNQLLPSIPGQTCTGPCCVPCPLIVQFYDADSMSLMFNLSMISGFLSLIGSAFTFLSYLLFPKKRAHPSVMMCFFSGGAMVLHATQVVSVIGDGLRISCVDSVTEAVVGNSVACPAQAFLLHFFAVYIDCWISIFMINLYLTIVWRKDWFSERYIVLQIGIVVWSLIPAIGILATKGVRNIGYTCLFDVDHSWWFLTFMGVMGWPGVVITILTVITLCRMLLSAPSQNSSKMSSSALTSSNAAHSKAPSEVKAPPLPGASDVASTTKATKSQGAGKSQGAVTKSQNAVQIQAAKVAMKLKKHREKMWDMLVKSWRSIAICVVFVLFYGTFWIFNLLAVLIMKGVGADTPWVQTWYACALQGNGRDECASLAAPYAPSKVGFILANIGVNLIGTACFLIFGLGMVEDWRNLITKR
ncbi:hypothetical protein BC830DRAFT_1117917 [Chytriomyces sp. MP71]|nr:hypothetical protein BC830DRAFT_1117917 [Chytriomyces sp. MP71]